MPRKDSGPVDPPPKGCASRYGIERFRFDKPSTWPDWLEYFNRYLVSARLTTADDDFKINELILWMGPPSNAIFQRCTLTAEDKKSYEKVTKMFSDHFRGARNIVYELARLHRTVQRAGEPVDSFINAVFAQAENCDLDNSKIATKDLLTQSQLIAGMANRKLAAELQMDPSISLEQVVQRLRLDENIASQQAVIHEMSHANDGDKVDFVASKVDAVTRYRKRVGTSDRYQRRRSEGAAQCPKCGYDAHASRQLCPARRKACNLCKKLGHFAKVCKSKQTRAVESVALRRQPMRIGSAKRTVEQTYFLGKVVAERKDMTEDRSSSQPWRVELLLNGATARFKLDSGADVTCVPEGHPVVPAVLSSVTGLKLLGPSNRPLNVLGSFQATMKHKEHRVEETCYVVRDLSEPLLSRHASVSLRLIQKVTAFVSSVAVDGHPLETRLREIARSQAHDLVCAQLIAYCTSEWPTELSKVPRPCQPYWRYRAHLTVSPEGILFFDGRLVIPKEMRREILDRLHCGHQGIVKCAARARESVWWPSAISELEEFVTNCRVCMSHRQPRQEPMIPSELPSYPWQVVATGTLKVKGKEYLLVVDCYSRYIELAFLKDKTLETYIDILKSMFSRYGIPEVVRCDHGPCYSAYEFKEFAKQYGFQIVTSSPFCPQGNGEAERAVATMGNFLEKSGDIYLGLLAYRTTPMATGFSPAELMSGRSLRTNVPVTRENLLPRNANRTPFRQREELAKQRQSAAFNRRHGVRHRPPFVEADGVFIRDRNQRGTVVRKEPAARRSDCGPGMESADETEPPSTHQAPAQRTARPRRTRRQPSRYADYLMSERGM